MAVRLYGSDGDTGHTTAAAAKRDEKHRNQRKPGRVRMITTRIPRTRWHYLAYGGITAELAIQVQRSAKMRMNWAESSAW
jgi:hypothetical protein